MSTDSSVESSRAATNRLLSDLRGEGWRLHAWGRFLTAAGIRSVEQAVRHRRGLIEATTLHGLFALADTGSRGTHRRRAWVGTSWTLSVLHLGLLDSRRSMGLANSMTLARANLPVTGAALGRWLGVVALCTDFADGRFARRSATTTQFGRYADPFADAAFWTWLAVRDHGRGVGVAVALVWVAPGVVVAGQSFCRGQMIDLPKPRLFHPAVVAQILLAARTLQRERSPD